ncbi:hypothetical protein BJ322DRAFT_1063265 [Thelephora terrestris]|uniref:Protein kinase domain-containing protein n=1 Tax=Thelephora terrestris TaxID=56493 RepID=A0A9P6HEG7_9AGAM|nr:hypothetical protein BJ322DRAFT_1063265 [Thelephora terrestris]
MAKGLRFLHSNEVVQGSLRPNHIFIDNEGNARLAIDSHQTASLGRPSTPKDVSYVAPEARKSLIMMTESDVYGVAILVYQVLVTGIAPHWECPAAESSVPEVAEGAPARPHGTFEDLTWQLLGECWSRTPQKRPRIDEVYRTLNSLPKVIHTPRRPFVIGTLPRMLELHVHSIKFAKEPSQQYSYVRFKYGNKKYTTFPTNVKNDWGEHTWNRRETWVIQTDEEQLVSIEVLKRPGPLKKVHATGNFSFMNSTNKQFVVLPVTLTRDHVSVKILMTAM